MQYQLYHYDYYNRLDTAPGQKVLECVADPAFAECDYCLISML